MSIQTAYRQLIKTGQLRPDAAQEAAIEVLSRLKSQLRQDTGWRAAFMSGGSDVRGLYLWGPPGRGKSMMMDLFYENVRSVSRLRIHFHAFMSEVHHLIRKWRESDARTRREVFGKIKGDDPIVAVAQVFAKRAKLLCFDELQVTDIADAVILGRLIKALLAEKTVLVFTSNRAPDDLYKNGQNRDLFVPFIEEIKRSLDVVEVAGPKDFRLDRLKGTPIWFSPLMSEEARAGFEALWVDMTRLNTERECVLTVNERKLTLKRAAGPLLRATFAELCAAQNGPADYLAIAETFTTLFIADIPKLGAENRNEAKRFVTLIDALYEAGTKLVALADTDPASLYPAGDGAFEFERTVSRLEEMQSEDYLNRAD